MMLWFVLACTSSDPLPAPPPVASPSPTKPAAVTAPDVIGIQPGVQHPPIPADSPAWRHDPGGFVPDPRFYGEHDWDGVRVRVLGHLGVIERDRARWLAGQGRMAEAAEVYAALARDMERMAEPLSEQTQRIPALIQRAASRDADRIRARAGSGSEQGSGVEASAAELPDISSFKDFDDRHEMRIKLWALYLEAADALHPDTAWGYFDRDAFGRQLAQRRAVAAGECPGWVCPTTGDRPEFTVEGVGGMPTGDSLIDVGGEPGPKAIGTLEKLSLSEPVHRQWVEDTVYVLNARLNERPGAVLSLLKSRTDQLDAFKHGSRYYNIKQLRNEGVRVLAGRGHYDLARQVLAMNFPLHHQDWECPNREGILLALDARLAALDASAQAPALFARAREVSMAFLERVNTAEGH